MFYQRHNSLIAILTFAILATCGAVAKAEEKPVAGQAAIQAESPAKAPDKLVFAFQKQKDPKAIKAQADQLAAMLTKEIGVPVEVVIPANYAASVQALISNRAHVAYTDSLPFILARAEAPVRLLLAEERDGRTDYDSIYVVAKDSPIQSLADAKGKRMMFTSPTSTSGFLMARSRLVNDGLLKKGQEPGEFFGDVNYAGGYDRALLAVLNGQADICAVSDYTMEGKKADVYLTKEQRNQLRILTETPGVPTHLISVRADLPEELQEKIKAALLKVSSDHPELIADVYGAAKLVEVDADKHVAAIDTALENTGLTVNKFVKISQ